MSSSKSFMVCAFYTIKTPYEREVRKLKKSCRKFSIPYEIIGIESQGNWEQNCAQKPKIIKEVLSNHPGVNVVYLDADARIMRPPVLFEEFDGDIGVHYLYGKELLSGTIFLRNCNEVFALVHLWGEALEGAKVPVWDQIVLQDCLREFSKKLKIRVKTLPANYCQIFDFMEGAGKPVIKHMQASRRFKKTITSQTFP